VERLEESQLDNYTDIKTLIGVEFDENTVWGQLTILELKLLSTKKHSNWSVTFFNTTTIQRNAACFIKQCKPCSKSLSTRS